MSTIAENLLIIAGAKSNLVANLTTKGVTASETDPLDEVVAKVLDIVQGPDTSDATAVAGDVRTGTTAYVATGKVNGSLTPLDTSDADATASDIKYGKTAYVNGVKLTGTHEAPPVFVSATTNEAGTVITVEFDKEMADPTGKHAQFTVNDGAANAVTAVALNATTTKIDLTLTNAIEYGDVVTVAYTKGTVASADTGVLASFEAQSVTNAAPNPYQQWTNYPQSPVLTADYPYQAIGYIVGNGNYYLLCCSQKFYHTVDFSITSSVPFAMYRKDGSVWTFSSSSTSFNINNDNSNIKECNNDIYTSALLTTVRISKTT